MEENIKTDEREIKEIDQAAEDYAEQKDKYKYIAFISYRHLEPDATVAKKIHTMIETFKLPKEFYENGEKPNFRVFRDREELTASSLDDSIDEALKVSKFIIVICSKRLPESEWCNKEVETFIKLHGVDRVIPVLIEGEPEDSFPEALLKNETKVELEDGSVVVENKNILAAELRPKEVMARDFVGYKELSTTNPSEVNRLAKESVSLLKTEKYRIMAAILGVSYGDLKQRDKARRQRSMLILSAIVSMALTFFGIFMFNAYRSENIAKRQTIQDRSQFMLDEANVLLTQGNRFEALQISNQALEDVDADMENYGKLKSEHLQILNDAVNLTKSSYNKVINTGNQFTFLSLLEKKNYFVAGLNNDSIGLWDIVTGKLINTAKGHTQQVKLVDISTDEKTIVSGGFDDVLNLWNSDTLESLGSVKTPGNVMLINFSSDDKYLDIIYDTIEAYYYQRYDVSNLEAIGEPIKLENSVKRVTFDKSGRFMFIIYDTYQRDRSLVKYDILEGKVVKEFKDIQRKNEFYEEPEEKPSDEEKPKEDDPLSSLNDEFVYDRYTDLRTSRDEKYIYLINGGNILKMDMKTDEVIYKITRTGLFADELILLEDSVNNVIYHVDFSSLVKYDLNTGEKLKSISTGSNSIKKATISSDGKVITASNDKGELLIVKEEKLTEIVPNLDNSYPEYIYSNADGKYTLTLSLSEQRIKILEIASEKNKQILDGQIAGTSKDKNYALIYSKDGFTIWNNAQNVKHKDIKNDYLDTTRSVIFDGAGYELTDNARYLSGLKRSKDDLIGEIPEIFVIDTTSNQVVYTLPIDRPSFYYGFSSDGSLLMLTTAFNEVTIYSVQEKKEVVKIVVDSGFVSGIDISDDNKYLVVNYTEGVADVYDIATQKKIGGIAGKILSIDVDEEGNIDIVSIYNNVGSKYKNFEKIQEDITMAGKMNEHGTTYQDVHSYNKAKDLLLTIKSKDNVHYGYLVDFSTGELIQSYVTPITGYTAKGVISPKGNSVIMDYLYSSSTLADETYDFFSKTAIYPIEEYDVLNQRSKEIIDKLKD